MNQMAADGPDSTSIPDAASDVTDDWSDEALNVNGCDVNGGLALIGAARFPIGCRQS